MKLVASIVFFLSSAIAFSQYGNLFINQQFDLVYGTLYGPIYDIASTTNNVNAQGTITWNKSQLYSSIESENELGSSRSGSLEALLVMYEATCDKKYLWEFMEQATIIVNNRADNVSPQQSGSPYWFREQVPWHGRLLMPMAKFVYLVQSQNLSTFAIPAAHQSNFAGKTTLGEFATWLNTSNIAVMDFLLGRLWRGNDECMCKPHDGSYGDGTPNISRICKNGEMDNSTSKSIMELNMQAPFGCALIYMYLANGDARIDYAVKAVEMARAYLVSKNGILTYNSTYHAYSWYHDGWQWERDNILQPWGFGDDDREDLGHGAWDIMFPVLYNKFYNKFYPHVTAGQYFEDYQMVRFKNNFSRIVYNYALNIPQSYIDHNTFDCSVFGGCSDIYDDNNPANPADYQNNAKCWTSLYKFDNHSDSQGDKVYDIMMNYYINVEQFAAINDANYGGINIKGLADLVAANRSKELFVKGCYTKSATAPIMLEEENSNVVVFPNPADNSIEISSADKQVALVEIFDMSGNKLLENKGGEAISVAQLANGIYSVMIYFADDSVEMKKVSIQR
ncbi:MAG TPA: T9SS type A sorting domain-containing protein [Fluviicola sp.]|nr:T9SS type A sorting domain-containing protein [Fluviicola sp.]